jgi:hypothetical protein
MSIRLDLYVVDEAKLPTSPNGTDQERYDRLVKAVLQNGASWATIDTDGGSLIRALEAVDAQIGGRKFLPVFAFNNSPANVLGNNSSCPDFGYFRPEAARDLAMLLSRVPDDKLEALRADKELYFDVYWKFRDAAEEATRRGHAVAVLHDPPSLNDLQDVT